MIARMASVRFVEINLIGETAGIYFPSPDVKTNGACYQRNVGVLETPGLWGRASIKEARTDFQEPGRPQFQTNPKKPSPELQIDEENIFS